MSDLQQRLRRTYDPVPAVTVPEIRARARRRSRNRRAAMGGSLVVVLVGLAVGLGVLTRNSPPSTSTSGAGPGSTVASGTSRTSGPSGSSAQKPKPRTVSVTKDGITVRFTLDTPTVAQGGEVKGVLTVKTAEAIRGCPGTFYALVLKSPRTGSQGGSFNTPACVKVAISPGTHTYHVKSRAEYGTCTQSPPSSPGMPMCGKGSHLMPVLPAGSYTLTLAYDLNLPVPAALPIKIVKA